MCILQSFARELGAHDVDGDDPERYGYDFERAQRSADDDHAACDARRG